MSAREDLTLAQRYVDDPCRTVGRGAQEIGDGPDVRRVGTGTGRLRESITLLRESTAAATPMATTRRPEPVVIPDGPYDSSQWTKRDNLDGLDDEGLGAQGRHAP
ncbi:hypothetical protein [Streptomyces odontomachi]|uniref:hypothetical protein n=1 Tax=Streptomyces odontomachi TaxID=2944940 RepID=UPI002109F659|nr:hypothetical protein [Streptomyces sp. ODS25]